MEYIVIIIAAIFVQNIVVTQFLGMCSFLGVTNKVSTTLGMTGAVTFVIVLSTIITYIIQVYVLNPLSIAYLQTVVFVLIIAGLVQMVEIVVKKISPSLYQALGIYLPLITTNCAVLAVTLLVFKKNFNLVESAIYATAASVGYGLALTLMAGIREQLEIADVPKGLKGVPISLITGGLLAMAFMGFAGIVK